MLTFVGLKQPFAVQINGQVFDVDEFANRIRNLLPAKGLAMNFDRDVRAVFDSPEITQILCSPRTVSQAKSLSSKTEKANKKKIQSDFS